MKRYSGYKDSVVEWIGEIPSHWEVKKLKYLVSEIIGGGTPDTNNIDYWDFEKSNGVPWIAINDMSKYDFIKDTTAYITSKGMKSKRLKLIPKGNLIYSIYATIGKVSELCIDATINQALLGLIVDENIINKNYMKFSLMAIEKSISSLGSSNTQNNLNLEKVRNIELSTPPLEEQEQMVNYLDKKTSHIDNLISKKEELIETLKASRTKLISETVTKGLDKNVPMKDSGVEWIGKIPSCWEVKRLKYISDIIMGQSPDSNDYNFEGKGRPFLQGNAEFTDKYPIPKVYCEKSKKFSRENDILMSVRAPVGEINISNTIYGIGRGLCSIKCNVVDKNYMWYAISIFINELKINSKGTTYESVTMDDIKNMTCIVPTIQEQEIIVDYLDNKTLKIDNLISKIEEQIELLKKAKQKLITEVVTGKIDVTNL